jgi:hypothetical protein
VCGCSLGGRVRGRRRAGGRLMKELDEVRWKTIGKSH